VTCGVVTLASALLLSRSKDEYVRVRHLEADYAG
jgi:hypothetical protein